MNSPSNSLNETYNLQIQRKEWRLGLSYKEVFYAIEAEFERIGDPNKELRFVIQENFTEKNQKTSFNDNEMTWEAICENPEAMRMYLRIGWKG